MFYHMKNLNDEEFWCSHCDCEVVKSDDPSTGKFFYCHGHVYDPKIRHTTGEWPMIVFALCHNCLDNLDRLWCNK